jgi:uncharacterized protein YbjT (DUF2867 family)
MQNKKTALIVGATGLIGNLLAQKLLQDTYYQKVILLVRKSTGIKNERLEERIVDFDNLKPNDVIADDVFCCLGTTIKKAGSQAAFYKVDFEYPLRVATLAAQKDATQFLIVTALGADAQSSVFYNRVKGEVEQKLSELPLQSLSIFRPSLLLGDRQESRFGENIGKVLAKIINPLMIGSLKKYRGIEAEKVANAMQTLAKENRTGKHIFESDFLQGF